MGTLDAEHAHAMLAQLAMGIDVTIQGRARYAQLAAELADLGIAAFHRRLRKSDGPSARATVRELGKDPSAVAEVDAFFREVTT
jgi:hypothetical protein